MLRKRRIRGVWGFVRCLILVLAGTFAFVESVGAQGRVNDLMAEGARLRTQLEAANAEVSALKRSGPGVRNDYRLRRHQADAEELARKLTAIEAELRSLRGGGPARPAVIDSGMAAEAPAALEARADLLLDEAQRLTMQAGGLTRAAGELRTRQTLQRRAGQIERDPFASMDGSKRFMLLQSAGTRPSAERAGAAPDPGNGQGGAPVPVSSPVAPVPPTGAPPPAAGAPSPALGPPANPVTTVATDAARSTGVAPASRALLDPAALAELRRLPASGGKPVGEVERLERAAAALKNRAQSLQAEAASLRSQAAKR